MSGSTKQGPTYVGTTRSNVVDALHFLQQGHPLSVSNLVNDLGFVTSASSPHADWAQMDMSISSFIKNKPTLANVATSGSASDLTSGTLPTSCLPYIDCDQIGSGVFPITRLPIIPSGFISGLAPIATSGNLWTGSNVATLSGNTPTPLGPGGFTSWNRDNSSGLTAFTNQKGAYSPGGWEWVSYKSDQSLETVSASLTSAGMLDVKGGFSVAGSGLAAVAMSGSASDIQTGTLPTKVLPQIPANNVSYGSFQSDLIPANPNQYNIGSSAEPWATLWGQSIYMNGTAVRSIATSASASDLIGGTLSASLLPQIPASQIASGSFTVGGFACNPTPSAASSYSLGTTSLPWKDVVLTGSIRVGSATVQPVALSGSASDLTTGVLAISRVPALPASQLTSGTFSVGTFACNLIPSTTNLSVGTTSNPWTNLSITNGNFAGVLTGGNRTDRCQIGLAGTNLLPGSTSYFGFGIGTNGSSAPGALESHVDKPASDFVWYSNTTELLRLQGSGNLLPGTTDAQCIGYFGNEFNLIFAKQFWRNGAPLQNLCTSGSASDIQTGTLPLAQVPALPPNQLSIAGTLSIDLIPATANALRLGTTTSPWGSVFAQQIYRNGVPLAAVATSGAWSDMQQPVAIAGTPSLNVTAPGFYFAYGRTAGSGRTTLASQRGASTAGGFEFLSYNSSNASDGAPLMTLDYQGNTAISGALKGLGSGGLLMRSWDENAPSTAGAKTHRFQGRPNDCSLVSSINLTNFSVSGATTNFASRLTGYLQPPVADTYTFTVTFKDAIRIWVNNLVKVDSWTTSTSSTTATFSMSMGTQPLPIMVEYFQTTGTSALQIQWKGSQNNTTNQFLTHGNYLAGSSFALYYDLYENPPSQLGTTWVNGPLYASTITNNGSGVVLNDKVDFGGNALYGVSFVNNKGSPIAVGDPLALASKAITGASNIGIGTPSPAVALDVFGSANNGQVHVTASDLGEASIGFGDASNNGTFSSSNCWVMGRGAWSSGSNMAIGKQGTGGIVFVQGGSSPSLGVNQATPQYNLDVTGTGRFTGTLYAPQIVTNSVTTNSSSTNNSFGNTLFISSGTGVSILKSVPSCALDVLGDATMSGKITGGSLITPAINSDKSALTVGTSLYLTGGQSPMVGVLQSAPQYPLDVAGSIRASAKAIAAEVVTPGINTSTPQPLSINNLLTLTTGSSPKVGILQTNPTFTLDITGNLRATTQMVSPAIGTSAINSDYSALSICNYVNVMWGGSGGSTPYMALNQSTPAYNLDVNGTGRFVQGLYANAGLTSPTINSNAGACVLSNSIYCTGGNVPKLGIANANPSATCDITGTLAVSGASTLKADLAVPSINAAGGAMSIGNYLFFTGGNTPQLGILQTNPQYSLDITGNCRVSGPLYAFSLVTATINPPASSKLTLGNAVYLVTGSSPMLGVNQSSPATTLDISGTARVTGALAAGSVTTSSIASSGTLSLGNGIFVTSSSSPSVGIFTSTPQTTFDCRGAASFSSSVTAPGIETSTINASLNQLTIGGLLTLTAGASQKLGVGTATPQATLDVAGSLKVSGATTFSSALQSSAINPDGSSITIGNALRFIGGSSPMLGILTTPQYTLDIAGNLRTSGPGLMGSLSTPSIGNAGGGLTITEATTLNSATTPYINDGGGALRIAKTVWVAGNQVGIMQSSPAATLDVSGNGNFTGLVTVGGLATSVINNGNAPLTIGSQLTLTGSKVGVFNSSPSATLDLTGSLACSSTGTFGALIAPTFNGDGSATTISKSLTLTGGASPKVGINISSPGAELDVKGNVNVSQTITTQYLTATQFNQSGGALTVGSTMWFTGGSNPMVGILQKSPQYTLDVAGNSQVTGTITTAGVLAVGTTLALGSVITCVPGSTSVGINRASPSYTLDVNGNAGISGNTIMGGVQTSAINAGGQALTIGPTATPGLYYSGGSTPKVGIAQGVPAYTLDVAGTVQASTSLITPAINGSGQAVNIASTVWLTGSSNNTIARVGILNSNPQNTLDVVGNAYLTQSVQCNGLISPYIALAGQSGHVFDITSGGVGLYQSSPQYSFDVTGNLRATTGINTPTIVAPSDSLKLGSNVYLNGGKVGIFQPSPGTGAVPSSMPSGTTLDVAGVMRVLGTTNQLAFFQSQTGSSGSAYLAMGDGISQNNCAFLQYNNRGGNGSAANSVYMGLYPTQNLTMTSSCLGVFNLNPQYPLDVGGNGNVSGTLSAASVQTTTLGSTSTLSLMASNASTAVSMGGTTSSPTLTVVNGMLGLQTTNPQFTLDVSGNGRVTGSLAASGLVTGSIGNNGNGVSFGSDKVTVSKMVLPNAPSFTGDVNELANTAALASAAMPIGSMIQWGANSMAGLPSYFFECLGQTVSRSNYSSLFQIIGTTYGSGDGSTTFTLPNLQGRVVCGYVQSNGDSNFPESGFVAGEQYHKLSVAEMPSHNHGVNDSGHAHGIGVGGRKYNTGNGDTAFNGIGSNVSLGAGLTNTGNGNTNNAGTGISIQNAGSTAAHNNLQPYIVMRYLIKWGPNVPLPPVTAIVNGTTSAGAAYTLTLRGASGQYVDPSITWQSYDTTGGVGMLVTFTLSDGSSGQRFFGTGSANFSAFGGRVQTTAWTQVQSYGS